MRISTPMIFDSGTRNLQRQQSGLYLLQNQMSTGRRILTPSEDPVATAQALVVTQQKNVNQQFLDNQDNATSLLTEQEDRLNAVNEVLQAVKLRVVEAGNGAYGDSDRKAIAAEIRERYDELIGLANSTDALGNYVFSGTKGDTRPFLTSGEPGARVVTYAGNDARRQLQVSTARIMDLSVSGNDVFTSIPQGNGVFMVTAGSPLTPNAGNGVVSASLIGGYDDASYTLKFDGAGQYSLDDGVSWSAYTSGSAIFLPSSADPQLSITISGAPAANDTFTIAPSTNQDIFKTLDQMISVLESGSTSTPASRAEFQNTMYAVSQHVDQAFNHILGLQTSVGARLIELDALTSFGGDLDLQYQTDISKLQDLDYTAAITSMAQRQMAFEAAQTTFSKISQLSLFNYL